MSDPQFVITPYRVFTFILSVLTGIVTFSIVPADIVPWIGAAAFVVSMALTVFFPTSEQAKSLGKRFGK